MKKRFVNFLKRWMGYKASPSELLAKLGKDIVSKMESKDEG
jgi:hypothetical protein